MNKRLIDVLTVFELQLWSMFPITLQGSQDVMDNCEIVPYVESTDEDTVQAVLFYNVDHDARYETN